MIRADRQMDMSELIFGFRDLMANGPTKVKSLVRAMKAHGGHCCVASLVLNYVR